jgi:argininosuccinate lyase
MNDQAAVSIRERLKSPPAPLLVEAHYAPAVANGLLYEFPHEMRIHLAHGLMLAQQKIVSRQDIAAILNVLLELRERGPSALAIDYKQEDLYSYVEKYIVTALGADVGGRLHTGRSRNDLHVTTWRLALRERLLELIGAVADFRAAVLTLAEQHVETVMPGYTHLQHAQPISLGYYLLAFADLLGRDHERLAGALRHADRSPLGAGALTTTGFPIDRAYVQKMLGFADMVEVAYDAVACRDDLHESAAAMAVMMTGISRLAFDFQNWASLEFGFIELDDAYSSVSSIMPQKKNPKALEHTKAAAGFVTGALTTVLSCSKNTSFGDVNDSVSAINVPVLDASRRALHAVGLMTGVVATLTVRPERMAHAAAIGFGSATELADVIVREAGLSFRMAHNIVGTVVRETIEAGGTALDIATEHLDRAAETLFQRKLGISAEAVARALDPMENIRSRTVVGGPAPDNVRRMIELRRAAVARDKAELTGIRRRIDDAESALLADASALANG